MTRLLIQKTKDRKMKFDDDYDAFLLLIKVRLIMTNEERLQINPYTGSLITMTLHHACNWCLQYCIGG